MADLAFWFGFQPSELEDMTLDEVERWLEQANRQIKAKYTKAAISAALFLMSEQRLGGGEYTGKRGNHHFYCKSK